jgi:arylformamidase
MPSSPDFIDISRPLAAGTACWPGDVPFSFRLGWTIAGGASVNVGAIETSVHTATHCDAPFHFNDAGVTADRIQLSVFVGPAWVIDVRGAVRWRDRLAHVDPAIFPRIVLRTGGWPDTTLFPETIPCMEPDFPDWLADRGARLIGVDLPSVDPLESKTLDNHHALNRRGMTIIEGLWLEDVAEGPYELVALPLKIVGADGSPVRAILRRI